LFVLLLVLGCSAAPAVKVDVPPGFDALFDNRKGWTGVDGAYSLSISDDLTLSALRASAVNYFRQSSSKKADTRPKREDLLYKGSHNCGLIRLF
jgi:hypothetical protein